MVAGSLELWMLKASGLLVTEHVGHGKEGLIIYIL